MGEEPKAKPTAQERPGLSEPPLEAQHGLDVAGESLGDALRLSFRILTVIIVMLILFFFSRGFFRVPPDQKTVVLVFGKAEAVGVKSQGLHYAYPEPINRVVRILIKPRKLEANAFYPKLTEQEKQDIAEKKKKGEAVPEAVEGSEGAYMLTGDLSVLQGRWDVTYQVKDDPVSLVKYFKNVGIDETYPYDDRRRYVEEERLVKVVLESAVVREVGRVDLLSIYPRQTETPLPERVERTMNTLFDELDCGIEIVKVNLITIQPPADVMPSFRAVLEAGQNADTQRIEAERERKELLIGVAGEKGEELGVAIDAWWKAKEAKDAARVDALQKEIAALFAKAGGEAQSLRADAEAYRTRIVAQTKGDADRISQLMAQGQSDAAIRIFLQNRHVEAMQSVLTHAYEKFLFQPKREGRDSTLELWLNRRPELLRKQREIEETR